MELHPSAITDHLAKENHIIYWEGMKFHARDSDWTARRVKEAVGIRKTGAHTMERETGAPLTTIIVLQVAVEEVIAICHKQHNTLALMMPIVTVRRN